jgi:hypothetical protein
MDPTEENLTTEQPVEAVEAPAADAPVAELAAPEDPFLKGVEEATAAEAVVDSEAPVVPEGDPAAELAPEVDPKPEGPAVEDPKPDDKPKDVEAEIKELGITNERTQKRFRELTERAAEVEPLRTRAAKAEEWEQTIQSTGTNPEQFGAALNYLRAVNSGSPDAMEQAYGIMQKELQWLGEKLGKEAPGFDPLSKHADLQAKVDSGDLTREVASELAAHRQRGALATEHSQTQTQRQQQEADYNTGMQQVVLLGNRLRTSDPAFAQKMPFLAPAVELIQKTLPPAQWAQAVQDAYTRLPAIAAPAPARPATPSPIRAAGAPSMQAKPKNDVEAFSMGVDLARARGV